MRVPERSLRTQLWNLAESRRYLAGLEALVLSLRGDAERLREAAVAGDAAGRQAALAGEEMVARSIAEVEAQLVTARGAVAEAVLAVKHHAAAGRARPSRRPRRRRRS